MELRLSSFPIPKDMRIAITGGGRVAKGAMEVLDRVGFHRVEKNEFLDAANSSPIYTIIGSEDLYRRVDGKPLDRLAFHHDPSDHVADFLPYARVAHIYMACHFWDPRGPKILTTDGLRDPEISLRVIADISCDIGGPIDSTLHATTITDPLFGYDRMNAIECAIGAPGSITVMSVDNLPCELPRDASKSFGRDLMDRVLPHLLGDDGEGMIARATIATNGSLTEHYKYLEEYARGKA